MINHMAWTESLLLPILPSFVCVWWKSEWIELVVVLRKWWGYSFKFLLMIYVQVLAVVDLTLSPSVVYQLQTPTLSGHGERSSRVTYLSYQWLWVRASNTLVKRLWRKACRCTNLLKEFLQSGLEVWKWRKVKWFPCLHSLM